MQQESWGVLGLEFVDEGAERALGFILAERAERVFRVCFGWARWARARFCGKAKQVKEGVLCTEAQSISAKVSVCSRFLRFHCSFGVGDCWIKVHWNISETCIVKAHNWIWFVNYAMLCYPVWSHLMLWYSYEITTTTTIYCYYYYYSITITV